MLAPCLGLGRVLARWPAGGHQLLFPHPERCLPKRSRRRRDR